MDPLISSWSAVFAHHATVAATHSQTINDAAEHDLVTQMLLAAGEWYQLAEEAFFIQELLSALDQPSQPAITSLIQGWLAKMFARGHDRLLDFATIIERGDAARLLPDAQGLWDQGEIFVKKLGDGVSNTRS